MHSASYSNDECIVLHFLMMNALLLCFIFWWQVHFASFFVIIRALCFFFLMMNALYLMFCWRVHLRSFWGWWVLCLRFWWYVHSAIFLTLLLPPIYKPAPSARLIDLECVWAIRVAEGNENTTEGWREIYVNNEHSTFVLFHEHIYYRIRNVYSVL